MGLPHPSGGHGGSGMKNSMRGHARHEVLATSSNRTEWSWCGFGAGLLIYVVLSVVFASVPDDEPTRALWLALGLAPACMGFCIGLTGPSVPDRRPSGQACVKTHSC